jgi:hypothetical protein
MTLRLAFLLFVLAAPSQAQLLSPAEFLGYELGDQFTPHHRVLDYAYHVAESSPRAQIETYGESYEDRELVLVTLSTPERLANIDAVRQAHLQRIGLAEGAQVAGEAPAVVWLSYNVHGNESVSSEAALEVLHRLADPDDAESGAWLAGTVVLLDPMLNPDGRERYVSWYRSVRGTPYNADPNAREHDEPWPGGRTNHYYFDLNRDWAWQTQIESRQGVEAYRRWYPHVHADFHEQGVDEPYYFPPAAEPFHAVITPFQREWQTRLGARNALTFDQDARLFFTSEVFDLFYPSYGDTWPTYNGAIGMTYEQGGSGRAGLAIETSEGDTLTLAERIAGHVATSFNTVALASDTRAELVREMEAYYGRAARADGAPHAAYVVSASEGTEPLRELVRTLDANGIQYFAAAAPAEATGYAYRRGQTETFALAPGDLIVPAAQPRGTLARVLMEPEANIPDSLTYDITAWSLPYAHDLDAWALERMPALRMGPWYETDADEPDAGAVAYALPLRSIDGLRALSDALQGGLTARLATSPFRAGGTSFDRGTALVTRTGNIGPGVDLDATLAQVAREYGVDVVALPSGRVEAGQDLGSSGVAFVRAPRVAVAAGPFASSLALGEVWHFFDQQIGYPATLAHPDDLMRADALYDYDVIVLPPGRYSDVLTDERLERLRDWMRAGGRLVAMESAASALVGKSGFGLTRASSGDDEAAETDTLDAPRRYADRERDAVVDAVPGSVHRVRLDPTHPLAYGYDDETFALVRSGRSYAPLEDGWNVGVIASGVPVSGFAGSEAQAGLDGALLYGVEDVGRGAVVYLMDNPLFRGFWQGGKRLFFNAVFFAGVD